MANKSWNATDFVDTDVIPTAEMIKHSQMHGTLGMGRCATVVVAANDSTALDKAQADYVCPGTGDQTMINTAIASIPARGGRIMLLAGTYYISGTINLNKTYTHLVGQGPYATWIELENGANCDMVRMGHDSNNLMFNALRDLSLHGNKAAQTGTINGITIRGYALSDLDLTRIMVIDCKYRALSIQTDANVRLPTPPSFSYWDFWVNDNIFEFCEGNGVDIRPHAAGALLGKFWFNNNYITGNSQGIEIDGTQEAVGYIHFNNHTMERNVARGISFKNVCNSSITNSHVYDNNDGASASTSGNGIQIDDCDNIYVGGGYSKSILHTAGKLQYYNVHVTGTSDNIRVMGMDVGGSVQTKSILDDSSGDNYIRNNIGFVTENSGTATLVNGTTSIAVAHELAVTPVAGDIVVTPIEAWGNMTSFYIDTYTATHFTIHSPINPGQDVDFAWKAIVL